MANLFGINVAGLVASSIARAGGVHTGTLSRKTAGVRTPGSLAKGTNPTTVTYTFKGFREVSEDRRSGSTVSATGSVVTILGATLPVVPLVGDVVTIDGATLTLTELKERDPAGASYLFGASED